MSKQLNLEALSIAKALCQDAFGNLVGNQKLRSAEYLRAAVELQDLLFAKLDSGNAAAESRALRQWLDAIETRLDSLPPLDTAAMERGFAAARSEGIRTEGVLTAIEMPHDMREAFEAAVRP